MSCFFEYLETHAGLLSAVSSVCMLIVTSVYAVITWWHARYTKQTLLESIKQNKEEKQPYIVPIIDSVSGVAFDTSTYLRIQLNFNYELENVGDSSAVTVYTFLYARLQYRTDTKTVFAHLMPEYLHSLRVGQKEKERLHFETTEFRDIVEDLEICYAKNMKRIETDPSVTPYSGPIIVLRCLYMNMMGQWFESVLEQELNDVRRKSIKEDDEEKIADSKAIRVTNNNVTDGDRFEGGMINPSYSKLTRKMVDYEYVKSILKECREYSDSRLDYIEKS